MQARARRELGLQWGRDQLVAERRDDSPPACAAPAMLQWGRDQLVAERPVYGAPSPNPTSLQWGRDQLVAERVFGSLRSVTSTGRFNGAATNWSRRERARARKE